MEAAQGYQRRLSRKEMQVFLLMRQGLTDEEIAARMQRRFGTIRHHISAILLKLGAANRTDAVAMSYREARWESHL